MSTRPAKESVLVPPEIQTRLEAAGLRRTLATRAVLGLFLANPQGTLSHAQALVSLTARGLDGQGGAAGGDRRHQGQRRPEHPLGRLPLAHGMDVPGGRPDHRRPAKLLPHIRIVSKLC